jgi:predicted dehydrogenase
MIEEEALDAVVIASPHATHEPFLRVALARGLHALCEKPLCWGGPDPAGAAQEIAEGFLSRGLHLVVNAQWPYALSAYRSLYPEALRSPPREFSMLLSPRSLGVDVLPDTLPHALSLLMAVLPDPAAEVEDASARLEEDGDAAHVEFTYRARGWRVRATLRTRRVEAQPRPAAFGFDRREARRVVEMDGYRLFLEGAGRRVPLPDPTPLLVSEFVSRVSSAARPVADPSAVPGMRLLAAVAAAVPSA